MSEGCTHATMMSLAAYAMKVKRLQLSFDIIEYRHISMVVNTIANGLSTVTSTQVQPL
jgi:hypothetical protein